jgi:hypothetical protein
MPKKLYDVIPPKLAKKIEQDVKDYLKEEKKHLQNQPRSKRSSSVKSGARPAWVLYSIGGGVIAILFFGFLFFKLPKANIQIWPKVEVLSFSQTITADKSLDMTDIANSVIPAKDFEISKTLNENFPATGNASDEGKAYGTITVYNKADPVAPLTLRAGTHFMSDSGKLFRADEKIVVPAGKKTGGKVSPGSVKVKVQAVEGGDSYNISSSNFSVPGLKGTAYYYSIYAESDTDMKGGYAGKTKKVTDDDLKQAEDTLVQKLLAEAINDLKNQIPENYILLENSTSSEITKSETSVKSGEVSNDFNFEVTMKLKAIAFKKSDVDEFVKKYIISQLLEEKTLLDSSIKTDLSVDSLDVSGGKMVLKVDFSSGIYKNIDINSISLSLTGKNAEQINETITALMGDQLLKAEINFWPFWVSSSPKNQKAVNVNLMFE